MSDVLPIATGRVEITVTLIRVYEPNPADYPPGLCLQEMSEIDLERLENREVLAQMIRDGLFSIEAWAKIVG